MTIDAYINQQTSGHQRILRWLHQIIVQSDNRMRAGISWKMPFYTCKQRWIGYLNVVRSELLAVELAFVDGTALPNPAGLLENRGRKTIRSVRIRSISAIDEDILRTYIQEALCLNNNRCIEGGI